jgi:hypothetical protein
MNNDTRQDLIVDPTTFGGKNPTSLYVPMSEVEQEVLERLVTAENLEIHIKNWGVAGNPTVSFGDKRISLLFRMNFDQPPVPIPVHYFDLELRTRTGVLLLQKRYSTLVGVGQPIEVCAGMFLDLAWDIAIDHMSPELVKALMPGVIGLTTRRLDKDTGAKTLTGNMKLDHSQKVTLNSLEKAAEVIRKDDIQEAVKVTEMAGTKPVR